MKKRKIDQIQATAKMITALSKQDGFISIGQTFNGKPQLHLNEKEFLKEYKEYHIDESYTTGHRKLYIDYPKIHIFTLQTKEA